jgi:hypothetical protein
MTIFCVYHHHETGACVVVIAWQSRLAKETLGKAASPSLFDSE